MANPSKGPAERPTNATLLASTSTNPKGTLPNGAEVKQLNSSSFKNRVCLAAMAFATVIALGITAISAAGVFAPSGELPNWLHTAVDYTGKRAFSYIFILGLVTTGALAINTYFIAMLPPKDGKQPKAEKAAEQKNDTAAPRPQKTKGKQKARPISWDGSSRPTSVDPEFAEEWTDFQSPEDTKHRSTDSDFDVDWTQLGDS